MRILHFADAHIDVVNFGRIDPESALPVRVTDFIRSLDQIVDTAIEQEVDLVLFAGDAYKDRNPQPTFQKVWGSRIMKLSEAGIPTVLLLGNHDVTPAVGRANTLQEFATLKVPGIVVADSIELLEADRLGIPLQIVTLPWTSRTQFLTHAETSGLETDEIYVLLEQRISEKIDALVKDADPLLPLILTAHASVRGAIYGNERAVTLGSEFNLDRSLVCDPRFDYVALGHIHRHQSINGANHPPVVYPGSIERVDFGEIGENKGFIIAEVNKGESTWEFIRLPTRKFVDLKVQGRRAESLMSDIFDQLPDPESVKGAICRLQLIFPREWESIIDENPIHQHFKSALSFKLVKHRLEEKRVRLGEFESIESLTPLDLLAEYWKTIGVEAPESENLQRLAREVLSEEIW